VPTDRLAGIAGALEALRSTDAGAGRAPLDDLGRALAAATGQAPVALTARRDLLRELLVVAIDEAGEALRGRCTCLLRGEGSGADVRAGLEELSGLLELLDAVER
jgi:hypothetical protein